MKLSLRRKPRYPSRGEAGAAGRFLATCCILAVFWGVLPSLSSAAPPDLPSGNGPIQVSGVIGKKLKIEMKLSRTGDRLSGSYQYVHVKRDIRLEGSLDDGGGFRLEEYVDEKGTGVFSGRFISGGRMEGEWSRPDGGGRLPFQLAGAGVPAPKGEPPKTGTVPAVGGAAPMKSPQETAVATKTVAGDPAVAPKAEPQTPKAQAPARKPLPPLESLETPAEREEAALTSRMPPAEARKAPLGIVGEPVRISAVSSAEKPAAPLESGRQVPARPPDKPGGLTAVRAPALIPSHGEGYQTEAPVASADVPLRGIGFRIKEQEASAALTAQPAPLKDASAPPVTASPSSGAGRKSPPFLVSVLWNIYTAMGALLLVAFGMVIVIGFGDNELVLRRHNDAVPILVISLSMGIVLLLLMLP